jgi:hypothetical protein
MADFNKAKSKGFAALGIPVGSILVFKKDPTVTVKTLDDKNKVEYLGKPYSISTLAKQIVGSPVSGYLYFKFNGRVLKNLEKPEGTESSKPTEVSTPAPASESSGTPPAAEIDPLAGDLEDDIAG